MSFDFQAYWDQLPLSEAERSVAMQLAAIAGQAQPGAWSLLGLIQHVLVQGSVCLDLKTLSDGPSWSDWQPYLKAPLVSQSLTSPVVVDGHGLAYFARFYDYQVRLVRQLKTLMHRQDMGEDLNAIQVVLDRFFPPELPLFRVIDGPDLQRLAVLMALLRPLVLVTGGPGTGKTTTVAKMLGALLSSAEEPERLRIQLLAPTGKAAARLTDSLRDAVEKLEPLQAFAHLVPQSASTLHRALGLYGNAGPRHHLDNPLAADIIVVDEASMIDLEVFCYLLEAVPAHARLVLLGDPHQLMSVEVGAVLGDLFQSEPTYTPRFRHKVTQVSEDSLPSARLKGPLADSCVHLQKSYRFGSDTTLGRLAETCLAGDAKRAWHQLLPCGVHVPQEPGVYRFENLHPLKAIECLIRTFLVPRFRLVGPSDRLEQLKVFQLLTALKNGPLGVSALNAWTEGLLADLGLVDRDQDYYDGRPLLVTQNDYGLGVFNGDQGIVQKTQREAQVAFEGPNGLRLLNPYHLPGHETNYAMTIHKSQGSEYEVVAVVLPPSESGIISRNLIYTALTRAKSRVFFITEQKEFFQAVETAMGRVSGLAMDLP